MAAVNRWFIRCRVCLAVSAVDETPNTGDWQCGVCNGSIESMGRVERDRLIEEHLAAPCDDRCTFAKGPICTCKCSGEHHGSKRLVRVVRDRGPVPTVTPSAGRDQCRINAAEYRAGCAAILERLDPLRARRRAGYLPYSEYAQLQRLDTALRAIHAARTHAARLKQIRGVLGHVPTPDVPPNPIEAVAVAVAGAVATTPPLADVPFALSAPQAQHRPRQAALF